LLRAPDFLLEPLLVRFSGLLLVLSVTLSRSSVFLVSFGVALSLDFIGVGFLTEATFISTSSHGAIFCGDFKILSVEGFFDGLGVYGVFFLSLSSFVFSVGDSFFYSDVTPLS